MMTKEASAEAIDLPSQVGRASLWRGLSALTTLSPLPRSSIPVRHWKS
jgi:hypothetical protein